MGSSSATQLMVRYTASGLGLRDEWPGGGSDTGIRFEKDTGRRGNGQLNIKSQ